MSKRRPSRDRVAGTAAHTAAESHGPAKAGHYRSEAGRDRSEAGRDPSEAGHDRSGPAKTGEDRTRRATWRAVGVIVLAGALVYAGSLSYAFIFDDQVSIVTNASIRDPWSARV